MQAFPFPAGGCFPFPNRAKDLPFPGKAAAYDREGSPIFRDHPSGLSRKIIFRDSPSGSSLRIILHHLEGSFPYELFGISEQLPSRRWPPSSSSALRRRRWTDVRPFFEDACPSSSGMYGFFCLFHEVFMARPCSFCMPALLLWSFMFSGSSFRDGRENKRG